MADTKAEIVKDQPSIKTQAIASLGALGLKTLVAEFENATCQVNLAKSQKTPSPKSIRHLDMTTELATHLKGALEANLDQIVTNALKEADGVEDFEFKPFGDGRIAALAIGRFSQIKEWLDKFPKHEKIIPLSKVDNHISQLKFTETVVTFGSDGKKLRIFCKTTNPKLAKLKIMASLIGGAKFDYLDPSKLLVIDTHIDFFIWDETIFIVDYKRFEALLDFRSITKSIAASVLEQVTTLLPVTHAAELRAALLSGARSLNKIASLHNKGHLPQLEMAKIQTLIASAKLPLKVVTIGGVQTIDLDPADPAQVQAYVHILADDYVRSMLTEIGYIGIEKALLGT